MIMPGSTMGQGNSRMFPKRVLEPIDRISEVLFGLIMALTFTGTLSAAESGSAEVRTMLVGAIGCNLAWGFVDAIMYLMGCLAERGSELRLAARLKAAKSVEEARNVLACSLPATISEVLTAAELDRMRSEMSRL